MFYHFYFVVEEKNNFREIHELVLADLQLMLLIWS